MYKSIGTNFGGPFLRKPYQTTRARPIPNLKGIRELELCSPEKPQKGPHLTKPATDNYNRGNFQKPNYFFLRLSFFNCVWDKENQKQGKQHKPHWKIPIGIPLRTSKKYTIGCN